MKRRTALALLVCSTAATLARPAVAAGPQPVWKADDATPGVRILRVDADGGVVAFERERDEGVDGAARASPR